MTDPLLNLRFTVADPVPTNRAYGRRGGSFGRGGVGMFLTKDGTAYKERVARAALAARQTCLEWPADPWRVAHARVGYQLVNYKGDTDGVRKALRDALEGVLYANDRVVEDGAAPLAIKDTGARRIEVVVELLALRTPGEAFQLAGEAHARTLKRKMKKLGIAGPLFK
jgi:Holliday junction resolvase RusA-like endonuclease